MPQALKKYAKNVPYTMQVKFMPATEAELKELGEDLPAGYIAGWASTPDLDSYRHIVKAGEGHPPSARARLGQGGRQNQAA
jgi:hypothetical protein